MLFHYLFFEIIFRRREFSSIEFIRVKDKASISRLNMLFDDSIPFSIHSNSYFFEDKSSLVCSNSSLRESISDSSFELWKNSSPMLSTWIGGLLSLLIL